MNSCLEKQSLFRYIPALDGLRAIAVVLVILFHAGVPHFFGGFLGVDIFFVLSGYLVTLRLVNEFSFTGRINFLRFYIRRSLRLYPPFLVLLLLNVLVVSFVSNQNALSASGFVLASVYMTDYAISLGLTPILTILTHTWSLAVEMKFYFFWPIALLSILKEPSKNKQASIVLLFYCFSLAWVVYCAISGQTWEQIYFRFDTRLGGLLLGAMLAILQYNRSDLKWLRSSLPFWGVLVTACVLMLTETGWPTLYALLTVIPVQIFTFLLIDQIVEDESCKAARFLSQPVLVYLGKISYGIYLYHYTVAYFCFDKCGWVNALIYTVPYSITFASLSYFTLETWAARISSRIKKNSTNI